MLYANVTFAAVTNTKVYNRPLTPVSANSLSVTD